MIRKATMDDLKPLAALYKELMVYHNRLDPQMFKIPDDTACEKKMKGFVEDTLEIFRTLCHETENVIDGFVVYMMLGANGSKENPKGYISVSDLIVAENARCKGIGTELINELYKIANENHCKRVEIDVHLENGDARKFYEKMGLKPKSIHMEKRL